MLMMMMWWDWKLGEPLVVGKRKVVNRNEKPFFFWHCTSETHIMNLRVLGITVIIIIMIMIVLILYPCTYIVIIVYNQLY